MLVNLQKELQGCSVNRPHQILAERDFESSLLEKHLHFCANVEEGEIGILPLFAFLIGHVAAQVACVLIDKPAYSPDNNAWLQTACHPEHGEYSILLKFHTPQDSITAQFFCHKNVSGCFLHFKLSSVNTPKA